jgi:hypothetical protein
MVGELKSESLGEFSGIRTMTRITDGHPINRIDELMPWAITPRPNLRPSSP